MAEPNPLFDNLPLDQTQDPLRLWRFVDNDNPSANLQLHLKTFALEACPKYIALSYAWGEKSSESLHRVAVNDGFISITRNLSDFLHTLHATENYVLFGDDSEDSQATKRNLPQHRWFWADQISINQADVKERDHQVLLMGDIYYNAVCVYAWLSDVVRHTDMAELEDPRDLVDHCWASQTPYLCMAASDYWTRLWVVQELTLARDLWLWSRCIIIHEKDFQGRIDALDDMQILLDNYLSHRSVVQTIVQGLVDLWRYIRRCLGKDISGKFKRMGESYVERNQASIKSLVRADRPDHDRTYHDIMPVLHACSNNECSDPRDKIFGLQSLIKSESRVAIDYTKSYAQVGRTAVWHCTRTMPIEIFTAHDYSDWIRKILQIANNLNIGLIEVTMLLWAYGLPNALGYLAIAHNRDDYLDIFWGRLCNMSKVLARTRMQIDFADELNSAFQGLDYPFGGTYNTHIAETRDLIPHWARAFMMLVIEIAERRGFLMYGDCLRHPDDPWPWPDGDLLPMNEYFKRAGKFFD